jgi:hypothetical protein
MRRTNAIAIATAAITAVTVGGVTFAMADDNDQVIAGCVNKETKVLRISNSCRGYERELTWNQRGSEGEAGDRGPKGEPGPPGPPGSGTGGLADHEIVSTTFDFATDGVEVPIDSTSSATVVTGDVSCPDTKKVLSGGWSSESFPPAGANESYPVDEKTWRVVSGALGFPATEGLAITVYAVCAT